MESTREEKANRLHELLQEALDPMTEKIEKLEEEIKALRESQEKLISLLAKKAE